ncbi:MAG: lipocalin family protein [Cyclobacteriaceae bacterium]|nr:lipocalin family protein [Cyclobacteriaceae bacterium]
MKVNNQVIMLIISLFFYFILEAKSQTHYIVGSWQLVESYIDGKLKNSYDEKTSLKIVFDKGNRMIDCTTADRSNYKLDGNLLEIGKAKYKILTLDNDTLVLTDLNSKYFERKLKYIRFEGKCN